MAGGWRRRRRLMAVIGNDHEASIIVARAISRDRSSSVIAPVQTHHSKAAETRGTRLRTCRCS
jgi:hypothetical protein